MIPAIMALPLATKIGGVVLGVVLLFSSGLYMGYQWGSKALPQAQVEQQINFTKTLQERWQISSDAVPIYIERVQKVKGDTQQLLTQVPVYVKDSCALSPGLRVLHDAAAQGQLPTPQRDSDSIPQASPGTPR